MEQAARGETLGGDATSGTNLMPLGIPVRKTLNNGNRRGDPSNAPRCCARRKSDGLACRQPAIRGRRVCRMHGGKGGAPRNERHGAFRHGLRSKEHRALIGQAFRARRWYRAFLRLLQASTEVRREKSAGCERRAGDEISRKRNRVWRADGGGDLGEGSGGVAAEESGRGG